MFGLERAGLLAKSLCTTALFEICLAPSAFSAGRSTHHRQNSPVEKDLRSMAPMKAKRVEMEHAAKIPGQRPLTEVIASSWNLVVKTVQEAEAAETHRHVLEVHSRLTAFGETEDALQVDLLGDPLFFLAVRQITLNRRWSLVSRLSRAWQGAWGPAIA